MKVDGRVFTEEVRFEKKKNRETGCKFIILLMSLILW